MNQPLEPTLDRLPHPLMRYFVAIRPAFLSVTFVGCLLGLATAALSDVTLDPLKATVTAVHTAEFVPVTMEIRSTA